MYYIHSRLDIFYPINILSQFMSDLRHRHCFDAKHVLRYLLGTISSRLKYASSGGVMLLGYFDSDWGGSIVD